VLSPKRTALVLRLLFYIPIAAIVGGHFWQISLIRTKPEIFSSVDADHAFIQTTIWSGTLGVIFAAVTLGLLRLFWYLLDYVTMKIREWRQD
jgi:hypothetical protein